MTRAFVTLIAAAFHFALSSVGALPAAPTLPPNVEFVATLGAFSKYRLKSNGMPIYLSQNHAAPVVTFMVVSPAIRPPITVSPDAGLGNRRKRC